MTPENPTDDSGWDRLKDPGMPRPIPGVGDAGGNEDEPLVLSLFAATWADIVSVAAVATGAMLSLILFGHRTSSDVFPWAFSLALMWWALAGAVTLVVRRGTPGMLAAGIVFEKQLRPARVPAVLVAALAQCLSLGLTAFLGAARSPLRAASGVSLGNLD